ncbi:Crp/Fnr family transcriptional regulator [Paenibacillus glycinis]|uniref:Helix-turn-helix domain-containing protein n=1 Tax=Paenibacillus glycinis TaxID=2697035 RepID=A0ABW9XWY0_9BACL|nr:Crp/Fnr family transcriptional regulator [Paenibacillus glycinis]NBD26789.1 helix-turn-helix domain-containing protein [Paenibacillus glycinis]
MTLSVQAELPRILELFPSLAEIGPENWGREDVVLIELPPNHLVQEGQLLDYAVLLLDGTIRMFKISPGGREITLYRIQGGECCPLMMTSILGESEYEASACIEKPSLALAIPSGLFREWMDRYRGFRQYIFKMVGKRLILMSNLLDSINFKTIPGRVAEFLYEQTASGADTLALTHDAIATELGTAREVISRTLKSFEKEGILALTRGRIAEIKRDELERYLEY